MTKAEYLEKAFEAYNKGRVDAEIYDAMVENADIFCDDDDDDGPLPPWYAEVQYTSEQLENDPIAIEGAKFDDMNFRRYTER